MGATSCCKSFAAKGAAPPPPESAGAGCWAPPSNCKAVRTSSADNPTDNTCFASVLNILYSLACDLVGMVCPGRAERQVNFLRGRAIRCMRLERSIQPHDATLYGDTAPVSTP